MRSPLVAGLLRLLRHQLGNAGVEAVAGPSGAPGKGWRPKRQDPALFVSFSAFKAEFERGRGTGRGNLQFGPVSVEASGTPGGEGGLEFSLKGTSGTGAATGEVDMNLAVSAPALRAATRLPGLPDSAHLDIPVRGVPPGDWAVDWAAALGRLTALLLAAPPAAPA